MKKAMREIILINFILFFVNLSFSQTQEELLEEAYDNNSVKLLENFFENWRKEKLPINDSEYNKLSNVQKDVYDLFYEFYNPLDMKHMKLEEWEYTMYENVKYVIIKNKIHYSFTKTLNQDEIFEDNIRAKYKDDSLEMVKFLNDSAFKAFWGEHLLTLGMLKTYNRDSIKNFHPNVKFTKAKLLYFRKKCHKIISEFLGTEIVPSGEYSIMQPAFSKNESEKRRNFLNNFIFVMISHRGDYWVLLTSPILTSILFDDVRDNAIIYYNFPYHAGCSVYTKSNGKWEFVWDKFTMMW